MNLSSLGVDPPPPGPADWNDRGVVILPKFFEFSQLAPYRKEWAKSHGLLGEMIRYEDGLPMLYAERPGGWPDTCPYMRHSTLRELCCSGALGDVLGALTGDDMGVNLNLTGWVSTERDWHADSYLNEPEVGDWYAAVWIALADIHPLSGVFQYVPGSHRWPQITRDVIGRFYDLDDPTWPKQSEGILTTVFDNEINRRSAHVVSYAPKMGDVLIWHGRLLHRGSKPFRPLIARPALIAHYSGVHHRPRMPDALQHSAGGWYFPIHTSQPVNA